MSKPTARQFEIALAWLGRNEGGYDDIMACDAVAAWIVETRIGRLMRETEQSQTVERGGRQSLTKIQQGVLMHMRTCGNASFATRDDRSMTSLERKGLITHIEMPGQYWKWTLTYAGRAEAKIWIAKHEREEQERSRNRSA